MNARMRQDLLADAAAKSQAHPVEVEPALARDMRQYWVHAWTVYAVVLVIWITVTGVLVLSHPAASALIPTVSSTPQSTTSPTATEPTSTITPPASNGASDSPTESQKAAELTGISLVPAGPITVVRGSEKQFAIDGQFSDESSKPLTEGAEWTVNPGKHLWVSDQGLVTTINPSSIVEFAASDSDQEVITVTVDGFSDSATVRVVPRTLVALTIRQTPTFPPRLGPLVEGDGATFTAHGTYNDNTTNVVEDVTWDSTNKSVATINPGGELVALATGSTDITATSAGVTGSLPVMVESAIVVSPGQKLVEPPPNPPTNDVE
ncbi:Ig-like domain-containing protein [Cryobacterium sp. CG_9.6]|uniref:Ig-like domain-containing protein n=1 Tax=Cryobacterium sp. CG_9.6 TaxID=2760710 RepID=UPI002474284B|nr:Ig-like domain-containing protein [Cryobacterium sp. CG_9.6]MDH6236115.1 hypothetical protein [Cryobacterium sp. CG_9.6]